MKKKVHVLEVCFEVKTMSRENFRVCLAAELLGEEFTDTLE